LETTRAPPIAQASGAPLLALDGVGLAYRGRAALDAVSLTLKAGETLALLGPNGAGKTSLMRLSAGRLAPRAGTVRVAGADPYRHAPARRAIGWVPQDIALYPRLTVAENLDIFARFLGLPRGERRARVDRALALGQVEAVAASVVGALSGGYQRRATIAAALLGPPRLALLDEPTQGVDLAARAAIHAVLDGLKAAGAGIVVATHDFAEAERLADRVAILEGGRLVLLDALPALLARARSAGPEHDLRLAEPAPEAAGRVLAEAGFAPDADGLVWRCPPGPRHDLDALMGAARARGAQVREVRAREPGLESVYRDRVGAAEPGARTDAKIVPEAAE
jgi:ABC-2 type transport system ATP-binding protein